MDDCRLGVVHRDTLLWKPNSFPPGFDLRLGARLITQGVLGGRLPQSADPLELKRIGLCRSKRRDKQMLTTPRSALLASGCSV